MRKILMITVFCSLSSISFSEHLSDNCTSILVTKGASQDGSVMITYACDAECLPYLKYIPAEDHEEDEYIEFLFHRRSNIFIAAVHTRGN